MLLAARAPAPRRSFLHARLRFLAAFALLLSPPSARAQDDGPRVYQLAPTGAQNVTAFAVYKRGDQGPEPGQETPGQEQINKLLVFRYARTFDLAGRQFTPFVIVPTGEVELASSEAASSSSGLGDVQIGATIGLAAAPALSRAEYASFRPALSVSLLGRVYLPTGAYSSSQPVNLGANRTAYQVGLPTTIMFGQSYRDEKLTSVELLPTVTFYEPNEAPFGAERTEQAPLYTLEAHLTHNLSRRIWISADVLARSGGETRADGVAVADAISGWSAGASLAIPFTQAANLIFTYQHVVERRDPGPVGWFFRTALVIPL